MTKNIITSVFFTGKKDPQAEKEVARSAYLPATISPIKAWYDSAISLGSDVEIILFHDGLPAELIDTYTRDNFTFIEDPTFNTQTFPASNHRWTLYSKHFKNYKCDNIFATDCTDVLIKNNPFTDSYYIDNRDKWFIGAEYRPRYSRWSRWMRRKFGYAYRGHPAIGEYDILNKPILNCGLVGGSYNNFMKLATAMSEELIRINPTPECCRRALTSFTVDMPVLNYVGYALLGADNILSDEPIHSQYRMEQVDREDVWFIHK